MYIDRGRNGLLPDRDAGGANCGCINQRRPTASEQVGDANHRADVRLLKKTLHVANASQRDRLDVANRYNLNCPELRALRRQLRDRDSDRFGFLRGRVELQRHQHAGGEAGAAKLTCALEEGVVELEGLDQDGVAWFNARIRNEAAGDRLGP